ncbi:MAG: DUF3105 domain-containing protein [Caldilineales bacterium]|nr:DUF3105 domain-containing protein [Caldilineales bacterium]
MAKKKQNPTPKSSTPTARRNEARAANRRKQQIRQLVWVGVAMIGIALIAFVIGRRALNQPGTRNADLGNTHITEEQATSVTYNSRPPTSGPHYSSIASWGIHNEPVADGFAIHNLEDGGVGLWYDCPDGCPELVAQMSAVVSSEGEDGLLLAPYPNMETTIALTAWNRVDRFDVFDEERIRDFIDAYRGIDHHR